MASGCAGIGVLTVLAPGRDHLAGEARPRWLMRLGAVFPLVRTFSRVGLVRRRLLMFGLSLADFLTHNFVPAPW